MLPVGRPLIRFKPQMAPVAPGGAQQPVPLLFNSLMTHSVSGRYRHDSNADATSSTHSASVEARLARMSRLPRHHNAYSVLL